MMATTWIHFFFFLSELKMKEEFESSLKTAKEFVDATCSLGNLVAV